MEALFLYYFNNGYFTFSDAWFHSEAIIFSTPNLTTYSLHTRNQLPENSVKHDPSSGRKGREGVIQNNQRLILFLTINN